MSSIVFNSAPPRIRGLLTALAWLLALVLVGCEGDAPRGVAESSPDAVATWKGGALTLSEVESSFATARIPVCRQARRQGGVEQLVTCYRELATGLALEGSLLAEIDDVEASLASLEDYELLRRRIYAEVWTQRLQDQIEIDEADIEARFEADPGSYRRPGAVHLSNIFRRHDDPARPEATLAFLLGLKQRFATGETFDALAREYSQSETRSRGGRVGRVNEDDLPEGLRRIAFALPAGEVSDPIQVRGGAVLLYVHDMVAPSEPTLTEAAPQIRRELTSVRVTEAITAQAAGRELPDGSLVLGIDELVAALEGGDPEQVVLDVAGDRLEAGGLRRLAALGTGAAGVDDLARDRLAEIYSREKERRLLALELTESADSELRAAAEEPLREVAITRLVDERLRGEMEKQLDDETLRRYFDDNRHHYQSPLRFRLRAWDLPFGDDPPTQLRRMEEMHQRLTAGDIELDAAAELGGRVTDLGWRGLDDLPESIPQKARTYLLDLGGKGFTIPYQQDDALHLLELVERAEPQPLEFDEVAEQVQEDYLARFQQHLYRQVAEARLASVGFIFDEEAVRRLLAPPTETR